MSRLSKYDWILEGEQILREFAQDKIKILYLCERLKVTRGSFYHHFESIEDYIIELLKHWKQTQTASYIELAEQEHDVKLKSEKLNELVFNGDHAVEAAIRSWSFYQPKVKVFLDEVDEIRLSFLKVLFVEFGLKEEEAIQFAKIEYATLIGLQQLNPQVSKEELASLFKFYQDRIKL